MDFRLHHDVAPVLGGGVGGFALAARFQAASQAPAVYPLAFSGVGQAPSAELLGELAMRFLPYAWIVLFLLCCVVVAAFTVGACFGFYWGLRSRRAALLARSREERPRAYLE